MVEGNSSSNGKARKQPQDFRKKQPTTRTVYICNDSDISEQFETAQQTFAFTQLMVGAEGTEEQQAELVAAKAKMEQLQAAALENSTKFVFRSIGRVPYDDLVNAHPPTDEQQEIARKEGGADVDLSWNAETFPPALLAASIVEPKMTPEEIQEIWDSPDWGGNELLDLFNTALSAQTARRTVQLGNV